jgi:FmdE, Molybdenum formylmethanofuran dehydrogenase operon
VIFMKNCLLTGINTARAATLSVALSFLFCIASAAHAHGDPNDSTTISAQDWVTWGEVVHGGFGSHIALGIRIGEDALKRLGAKRRDVEVTVTEGAKAPCACVADGITLATAASAGQRSLTVLPKSTDESFMALIEIRKKKSDKAITYRIPASAQAPLGNMNIGKSPAERFALVMNAPESSLYNISEKK